MFMRILDLSNQRFNSHTKQSMSDAQTETNVKFSDLQGISKDEHKVLKTYESMLRCASKLVWKKCSAKLRPEKFYEHIISNSWTKEKLQNYDTLEGSKPI